MAEHALQLPFSSKFSVKELSDWLVENGIPVEVSSSFEDNAIDGESFLELNEQDIKDLVPKIGHIKKVLKLSKLACGEICTSTSVIVPQTPTPTSTPGSQAGEKDSISVVSNSAQSSSSLQSLSPATSCNSKGVPLQFKVPETWRPSVMACIRDKDTKLLTPDVRSQIVRDLMSNMFTYSTCPNREFCTFVAQRLILTYPFMRDAVGTGYGSWEKKLLERLHNVQKTMKRPAEGGVSSTPKRGRPKLSEGSRHLYPTVTDISSDEVAYQRDYDAIVKEMEREKPRTSALLPLMKSTFPRRRQYVLSDVSDLSVREILRKWPSLRNPSVMEQEMDLIFQRQNVLKRTRSEWEQKWVPAILQYVKTLQSKPVQSLLEASANDDDDVVALKALCMILAVKKSKVDSLVYVYEEYELSDDPEIVAGNPPTRNWPRLAVFKSGASASDTKVFLLIEQMPVCQVSLSTGILLWFASFYIFNLDFCPHNLLLCRFMQEVVFQIPQEKERKGDRTSSYLAAVTSIVKFSELP